METVPHGPNNIILLAVCRYLVSELRYSPKSTRDTHCCGGGKGETRGKGGGAYFQLIPNIRRQELRHVVRDKSREKFPLNRAERALVTTG